MPSYKKINDFSNLKPGDIIRYLGDQYGDKYKGTVTKITDGPTKQCWVKERTSPWSEDSDFERLVNDMPPTNWKVKAKNGKKLTGTITKVI